MIDMEALHLCDSVVIWADYVLPVSPSTEIMEGGGVV